MKDAKLPRFGDVPHSDVWVAGTACDQHGSLRAIDQAMAPTLRSGKDSLLLACGHVPLAYRAISARGGQGLSVRRKSQERNVFRVPSENRSVLTGHGIPQSHGMVVAARCQNPSIRTEDDGLDTPGVAGSFASLLASRQIPQFQLGRWLRQAASGASQRAAVWTNCHRANRAFMNEGLGWRRC